MLNPYFLMTLLYLLIAALMALDASLISLNLATWLAGLRWLRVHFITLGMLTQILFGALPLLTASHRKLPRPAVRWDIWLALNMGFVVLLAGIPSVNQVAIGVGGTLVFIAAALLAQQLLGMRGASAQPHSPSAKFYITGVLYLLLGIVVGTGLWLGWSALMRNQTPLEVHIHANNWGFLSLVFAGLMVDLVPRFSGQPLASTRALNRVFWGMTLGALGLVAGPWLGGAMWATAPGLILHIGATVSVVVLLARGLARAGLLKAAGAWHLVTAYVWILLPVSVAPLIMLQAPGFVGGDIESTAPQALIYGWVLQFALALIPYLLQRYLLNKDNAALGGNWLSLLAVNAGSALVWASIFVEPLRGSLHGAAYMLYAVGMLPGAWQTLALCRTWVKASEQGATPLPAGIDGRDTPTGPGEALVRRSQGISTTQVATDQVMALSRGDD